MKTAYELYVKAPNTRFKNDPAPAGPCLKRQEFMTVDNQDE